MKQQLERIKSLGTEKESLRLELERLRGDLNGNDRGRVELKEPENDIRKIGDKFNDAAERFADDFEELREFLDDTREDLNEADATIRETIRDVGKALESTGRQTDVIVDIGKPPNVYPPSEWEASEVSEPGDEPDRWPPWAPTAAIAAAAVAATGYITRKPK